MSGIKYSNISPSNVSPSNVSPLDDKKNISMESINNIFDNTSNNIPDNPSDNIFNNSPNIQNTNSTNLRVINCKNGRMIIYFGISLFFSFLSVIPLILFPIYADEYCLFIEESLKKKSLILSYTILSFISILVILVSSGISFCIFYLKNIICTCNSDTILFRISNNYFLKRKRFFGVFSFIFFISSISTWFFYFRNLFKLLTNDIKNNTGQWTLFFFIITFFLTFLHLIIFSYIAYRFFKSI